MTVFFTVATANYLPHAVTLLDSVKKHHPDFQCYIGLVDYIDPDSIDKDHLLNRYSCIQLHELKLPEDIFNQITAYAPNELSNCSKMFFAAYFLNKPGIKEVCFSDADILFFNKLIEPPAGQVVLTPHFAALPPVRFIKQELLMLNFGIYNAGFSRFPNTSEAQEIIAWLKERCIRYCTDDRENGVYFDQVWYNLLPLYFKDIYIEKHPGYNVAFWNLHERTIIEKDGSFRVNDSYPLIFFHYSAWDYNNPMQISKWQKEYSIETRADITPLITLYKERLQANGYEEYIHIPNHYAKPQVSSRKRSVLQKIFGK